MFEPSATELASAESQLMSLVFQGRALSTPKEQRNKTIQALQDAAMERSLAAAARMMERLQWRPRASVALIEVIHCAECSSETRIFRGFGVAMFRNTDASERIVMTPALDQAFPRETHTVLSSTPACINCLGTFKFNLT